MIKKFLKMLKKNINLIPLTRSRYLSRDSNSHEVLIEVYKWYKKITQK